MTQEDLDAAVAAGDTTVMPITTDSEVGKFLADLLGLGETKDQETEDRETLDAVAAEVLKFVKAKAPVTPDTATETRDLTEAMAGQMMFTVSAKSIAAAAVTLAIRYRDLLDQWASLYVLATDADALGVADLTAPVTPEQAGAVESDRAEHAPNTGMYL
jgi:hypothetical protein